MKVDNKSSVAFNQKRNTVRISTKDRFAVGSVWIADMLHVPFGVSLLCPLWWWCCCCIPILTPLACGALPPFPCMSSALSGLPSGLKPQAGPQAAKLTRSKASTWCSTRKPRCTQNPAALSSMRCKRVRSSIRPTAPSRQIRTKGASWRIPIRSLTELLLRLLAGACSLPSSRNRVSRASSLFVFLCI
jgi:hypothetical protein